MDQQVEAFEWEERKETLVAVLHRLSRKQVLNIDAATFGMSASRRRKVVAFLVSQVQRTCGLHDIWLIASLGLLDKMAVRHPGGIGHSSQEIHATVLAAVLIILKTSSSAQTLEEDPKDVVMKMLPKNEKGLWPAVPKAELQLLHAVDYWVTAVTPLDFVEVLALRVADAAGTAWEGASAPRQRPSSLRLRHCFAFLASWLCELGIAHAHEIVYKSPPLAVALAAL